ncbi:MAG: hypothetical protein IJ013_03380 [Bacteroidaceae bacterium]|nr:hypothetical protein [Bacteroidaceae bacterium]
MKRIHLLLTALLLCVGVKGGERGALILRSPQDYQVYAISPNGEWACGVYVNLNNMGYGFRWNLLTGETELLSGDLCLSEASAISNEGVVAGMFDNTEATDNGAPAYTAGYWKDGRWHHLPNINNAPVHTNDQVGYANAITADGTYVGGAYNDKSSRLIPVVWKDGQIAQVFTPESGYEGMIYTVSADGRMAAGWSVTPNSEQARVATLWEVGKEPRLLMDERLSNAWCSARKFSPSGKWLLFWEGYYDTPAGEATDPTASNMALRALYNVETGEKADMPTITRDPFNFDIFDITDSGTVVGYESPEATQLDQAIIFKEGKTRWLYDYLKEQGVDMDADSTILREGKDIYFIRCVGISNDEKTFAVLYYDTQGALCTMVIKLDEDLTTREPVQLEAVRMEGVGAARLTWQAPLAGAEGVTGYNIYRDGAKVNDQPVASTTYLDQSLFGSDTHAYHVTALYGEVESKASQSVEVAAAMVSYHAPRNLFARQTGYSGALLQWDLPRTNLIVKSYYPEGEKVTGFGGGNNSFEAAIRIPAEEAALYGGCIINSVSFYPMTAQEAWRVNIYKKAPDGTARELIHTQLIDQPLSYGKENVVQLSGVECPTQADLYVAIEVTVPSDHTGYNVLGEVSGDPIPGQTDLLRMTSEPEFYSLYEEGRKFGATQLTTWAIAVNLSAPGTKVAEVDNIDYYGIYDGTEEVGVAAGRLFAFPALSEGEHTLGVKAHYKDGGASDIVAVPLTIVPNEEVYRPVSEVRVEHLNDHHVAFHWEAPMDDDETFLTHSTDALQGGVLGPSENNYNYIAATVYTPEKTRGYEGYLVRGFRFYPLTTAEFTFFLEEDGKVIAEAWPESYSPGVWNTVRLAQPLALKEGATYRLLLDCYDVTPGEAPLGLDARMPFVEEGDLYSLNEGVTYTSVSQASAFGNWMMGLVLTDPDAKPLAVEGYDVRIDNKVANTELLTATTFDYEFPEGDATHRLNVDVRYSADRTVKGTAVFFQVGPSSIGENLVPVLRVEQGDHYLRVTGCEVEEASLVNISGQTVACAQGPELNISALPAGTYVLRTTTATGVYARKVSIAK